MKRFFIWCSGISPDIILKCDSKEQIKYVNIGIIVLAVALLSVFSSTFFLSFAFDVTGSSFNLMYLPIGIIWGFIILSLDRAIVSTINKKDKLFIQITKAIPRFLLALMIGLVVATPLEFKIFEKEINNVIDIAVLDIIQKNKEFDYGNKLTLLEEQVEDANKTYIEDKRMYEDEVLGKKSGIPGKGARANEYMKNELKSLHKLNILKDSLNTFKEEIIQLEQSIDWNEEILEYRNQNVGILYRVKALYEIGYAHLLIALLFILIELLPLLIKLMSPKGSYEDVAEHIEEMAIKSSEIELENIIMNLRHSSEIKNKELHNTLSLIDNTHKNDLKASERTNIHNEAKSEIDYDNDLRLHRQISDKNRQQKEEELGFVNVIQPDNKTINKIKPNITSLEKVYWRQLDNPNNVYYFDTQLVNRTLLKPLLHFYKGTIDTGSWHYKKGKEDIITISLKNSKQIYKIKELTETRLVLNNNTVDLEFEKIDYM